MKKYRKTSLAHNMKILMISMSSIHFFRWAEQLKDSGHHVYWIDVYDSGIINKRIDFVEQTVGWRNKIRYPGRYWIKKRLPALNRLLNKFNQRNLPDIVERKIKEIKPDVVHSFILQSGALPLTEILKKYPKIKWIYSAWGNDLHFRKQNKKDLNDIRYVLPKLDFMFADCTRDYLIAKDNGFTGRYLGTFPTGGGYELSSYESYIQSFEKKDGIVIKGYQGKLGRCNVVLKAISELKKQLTNYKVIVFGANKNVQQYADKLGLTTWGNFQLFFQLPHVEVLKILGHAKLYIGNSISDGLPNTLLEAIIMESFPIQSNPGGATSELIAANKNGFLIENPEDSEEINRLILKALSNDEAMKRAIEHNSNTIRPYLDRGYIKNLVLKQYLQIEKQATEVI